MRRAALALAAALSLGGRAWGDDQPRALSLERATATTVSGLILELDGGVWLRDDVALERAKELVSLRAENDTLKTSAPPAPGALAVILTGAIALTLGVAGGVMLGLAARR